MTLNFFGIIVLALTASTSFAQFSAPSIEINTKLTEALSAIEIQSLLVENIARKCQSTLNKQASFPTEVHDAWKNRNRQYLEAKSKYQNAIFSKILSQKGHDELESSKIRHNKVVTAQASSLQDHFFTLGDKEAVCKRFDIGLESGYFDFTPNHHLFQEINALLKAVNSNESSTASAAAREPTMQINFQDPMNKWIDDMFKMHREKTLCPDDSTSSSVARAKVIDYLKSKSASTTASTEVVATALWTLYPCPFSPFRPELRPASNKEIEGVWLFPEGSQGLRFGARSEKKSPTGPLPVRCDAVGYYPNGELRHAIIAGQITCPFERSNDLEPARKNPRVSNWSYLRAGRVGVTRTDVANHIEEWDVYQVIAPFSFKEVQFAAGDLVAYIRRENGNEVGAATQFRHLKRLP